MKRVLPSTLVGWFLGYAERLERPRLFKWICALFLVNLFVIDPLPFIDEILLGLFALYLSRQKANPAGSDTGKSGGEKVVKGETVKDGRDSRR
ncbi:MULTISPECIES: DUF6116 family protein [Microbulbifer]|uniref:DUF6116 family protein n=1 Tax=Microbulbifer TaxID=48073 RepID=UPI0007482476|nr:MULTISPECIES: DUF6116 family protein [Microbulbifer]KUJ81664.1 hypothetical protein AVO43_14160 [Microbulbifer sp. ZGT114]